ncbi:cobalt-precorrin-5B (C(1))-methyltransferase CbiD [Acidianus sp. HS-5]|uniref:cobalt-precorrin-5B (C(1))-methyltransferase CbiD n=1 Tax=Acidianus sp. HS-5 TaxID=2886040 RepID=UPI001EFFBDC0|nr:cobalt-precorrin-5B (C(1))-methyltransferase CbiD [Acidianus sp. HS-5]BDC17934.1 cobalt-precorrin-5B (C(1))-methyltransferase [Acidianus sp. HS-5]
MIQTLKRFGITTGAVAAAAAKASAIYLTKGETPSSVTIPTPIGIRIEIPVEEYFEGKCAKVKKFSGDNPDVLDGLEITACSELSASVQIIGSKGIGTVTRPGLKLEIGEKSISPIARQMIIDALKEVTDKVKVTIIVPNGEELSKNTMNPDVGVSGGISILGTTGIEYPVSDEDYIDHIKTEMCVIKATGNNKVVLAPGNTSFSFAKKIYGDVVVKIGDRIGDSIKLAIDEGFSHVVIVSLPGKITKVSAGLLNTHSKFGDARIESIVYASVVSGLSTEKIREIANSLTVAEALESLSLEERKKVMSIIAKRVLSRLSKFQVKKGVIILSDDGQVLAEEGDL